MKYQRFSKKCDTSNEILTFSMQINENCDTSIEILTISSKIATRLMKYQHLNALKSVGYSELFKYLNKDISLEKAIDLIKQNTRRYAKRQITWTKRYPIRWIENQ